ncbi:hypothetical protein [Jeotgalibaca arthritidis]|uniref:Type 4a pilus biogenesis protein PilO n=1 Tax=Jeotgalibaca arthritidis TaxID=1868794 RepID=A0A6G7K888_9LACT|nr:hypothetical protein [Jeotgalibaca arthritidis]QII81431.1 hypothetical protein G7057_02355 [Jeotgalibaca arthritidis]
MKLKWNRLSISILLIMVLTLVLVFLYGENNLLADVKEQADRSSRIVEEQKSLLASYPADEELLGDYQSQYEETNNFLPEGEQIDKELLILEKSARRNEVTLKNISRASDPQEITEIEGHYFKSSYQVDIVASHSDNMKDLIADLTNGERIWNIYSFNFTKVENNSYNGSFTVDLYYHDESESE